MRSSRLIVSAAAVVALAGPLAAQGRGRNTNGVPPGQRPRAGMCRVWIDGVPPGQQPAPTDCATAARNLPANARIIYGDETPFPGKGKGRAVHRTTTTSPGDVVIDGRRCSVADVILSGGRTVCRDDAGVVRRRRGRDDDDNQAGDDDDDDDRGASRRDVEHRERREYKDHGEQKAHGKRRHPKDD